MKRNMILGVLVLLTGVTACSKKAGTQEKQSSDPKTPDFGAICKKSLERMTTCAPELTRQNQNSPEATLRRCRERVKHTYDTNRPLFKKSTACIEVKGCPKFMECAFGTAVKKSVPAPEPTKPSPGKPGRPLSPQPK